MTGRSSFVQKLISILLTSAFIYLVVLPGLSSKLSFFGTIIIVGSIMVISWGLGKFLAGDNNWQILSPVALIVAADVVLFTFFPTLV